jgi:hypothetical protein
MPKRKGRREQKAKRLEKRRRDRKYFGKRNQPEERRRRDAQFGE